MKVVKCTHEACSNCTKPATCKIVARGLEYNLCDSCNKDLILLLHGLTLPEAGGRRHEA